MSGLKKARQWFWLPATIISIGILSIILLVWSYRINERQRLYFALGDAVRDVQISATIYHLWLEENLAGDASADFAESGDSIDEAIRLVDLVLDGKRGSGLGVIAEPMTERRIRANAEAIKSLLSDFKIIVQSRLRHPETSGIGSTLDQQFDAVFKDILISAAGLEDIINSENAAYRIKSGRLFFGVIATWSFIVFFAAAALRSYEKRRRSSKEALAETNSQLISRTEELGRYRDDLEETVTKRTAALISANQQLRQLFFRLLRAQETERRRISMDLHDELGQTLNVMKLHVRAVGNGMNGNGAAREGCEKLQEYIDQLLEDVHRLSMDLSPAVLDDLGLTAALRWLIIHFSEDAGMKVRYEIAEIDHLFPDSHRIAIYRVIQEALTNIVKHAGAENVSLVIRRSDDEVTFSVKDDGKGFDPSRAAMKNAPEKGFGLATMNERVSMMGGALDLCSGKGKGACLVFRIPLGQEALNG